jgi:6-phosphogluconolactonase
MALRRSAPPRLWLLSFPVLCASTALAPAQGAPPAEGSKGEKLRVYVGTYTGGKSEGIYLLELDLPTGALTPRGVAGRAMNPSFLAIHPDRRFLYAVSEGKGSGASNGGAVEAFAIDSARGTLTALNQQSSKGAGPCHLVVDRTGKAVLVANYGSGSVAALPIRPDGRLDPASSFVQHSGSSVNPKRQAGPHAHSINLDPANRCAFAADLGLDKVFIYRFDADRGTLVPNEPPSVSVAPGAGPRHFAFHPGGRFAYAIDELNSTVTAFDHDPDRGALKVIQTATTLPEGFTGANYPAEVQVHPSGKFLYGSNRGHDSIAVFTIDADTGRLSPVGHTPTRGKNPRNFGIDPTGAYLLAANQDSDTVVVFRIDPKTGRLTPTGVVADVPKPVCVKFLPVGD